MENEQWIAAEELCAQYNIEYSFISSLQECGLVEIVIREDKGFLPAGQLTEVEKYIRLHYDMDINTEGIDVICRLLSRIRDLQREVSGLKARLRLYED